jgi:hypothetical protein
VRAFWTFLTSLLLAVLPAEGARLSIQDADACSSCRCCVQTNTNPAPARNAPAKETSSARAERQISDEPKVFNAPVPEPLMGPKAGLTGAALTAFPVPLFQRHCVLLI